MAPRRGAPPPLNCIIHSAANDPVRLQEIPVNHGSYFWYAAQEGLLAPNQTNIVRPSLPLPLQSPSPCPYGDQC